jgi:gamma-glutamylcyclotransferase (GGCT)/AIG2-like uncharacterized protein YtfP
MTDLVAVYGTLRYGGPANILMDGCEYLGQGHTGGALYNLGPYPGLKLDSEADVIVDVYKLPLYGGKLETLDKYEGYHPSRPDESLYTREVVEVTIDSGEKVEAWTYVYRNACDENWRIPSGDWFNNETE